MSKPPTEMGTAWSSKENVQYSWFTVGLYLQLYLQNWVSEWAMEVLHRVDICRPFVDLHDPPPKKKKIGYSPQNMIPFICVDNDLQQSAP